MKDSVWYNKLWQDKMLQFPLEGDENAAWFKMQGLLEEKLPVESTGKAPIDKNFPWSAISIVLFVAALAVLIYFAGKHIHTNNNPKPIKPVIGHSKRINSSNIQNQQIGDSLSTIKQKENPAINGSLSADTKTDNNTGKQTLSNSKISALLKQNNVALKEGAVGNKPRNYTDKKPANYNRSPVARQSSYLKSGPIKHSRNAASANKLNNYLLGADQKSAVDSLAPLSYSRYEDSLSKAQKYSAFTKSNVDSLSSNLKNTAQNIKSPSKTDSTKNQPSKLTSKLKNKPAVKPASSSKFELNIKLGLNTNGSSTVSSQNSNFYGKTPIDVFLGISGNYFINPKIGIGVGVNALSPRIVVGSYSNNNLHYITIADTGKKFPHNTGKITIKGSQKLYTVDIPLIATFKVTGNISFNAGPVIGIPVKQEKIKSNLSLLTDTKDTTALKEVDPYVNNTSINNKLNFGFSGGTKVNISRIFFEASYMRGITPYTISSGLGSGKIYYQTLQFGIGYQLLKPKK